MSPPADDACSGAPAGFWHRYAAWSLDAGVLLLAVLCLEWPRLRLAWTAIGHACRALVSAAGQVLADALMSGTRLPQLSATLLQEPRLHAAAAALQAALWQLAWPVLLAYALLALPWHVLGEASRWRGSPGKRAFGLAAGDLHGQRLSLPRAGARHVAGLLSWLSLNLGHLLAALPGRQALHDRIAGARVLHAGPGTRMPARARAWIVLQLLAVFALLAWLMLRYIAALQGGIAGW